MEDENYQKEVDLRRKLIQTLLVISGIFIVFPNANLSNPNTNLLIYFNLAFTGFFLSAIIYFISVSHNIFYYFNIIFDKLEIEGSKYNLDFRQRHESIKKDLSLSQNNIFLYSAINCANFFSILFVENTYAFEFPYMKYIKILIYIPSIFIIFFFLVQPNILKLTKKQLIYVSIYEISFIYFVIFYLSGI